MDYLYSEFTEGSNECFGELISCLKLCTNHTKGAMLSKPVWNEVFKEET